MSRSTASLSDGTLASLVDQPMTSEKEIQDRDLDLESATPAPAKQEPEEAKQKHEADITQDGDGTRTPNEFEVWWDEPANQDPTNPMNWSKSKKWSTILTLSSITFLTPLASSMFAPGIPDVMSEFHTTSSTFATFVVSVFVLGFAFGPLILAPLSEMYGRAPIYNITNILFLLFTIGCTLATNAGMLIAFRFLSGVAGVATITCGSGTIADIIPVESRGVAMSIYSIGPLLGPVIGPVVGGFLIEARGWRWVFWLITICTGVVTILTFFLVNETYPVIILERKAEKLRKETGNPLYRSRLDTGLTRNQLWKRSLVRPMKMLFMSPIVASMCTYIAVMYGMLYILFTTFTFVFEEVYHFSTSIVGLAFLGSGVGMFAGLLFVSTVSDKIIKAKQASGQTVKPEDRLPRIITLPASLCMPTGLIIYGWATEKGVHWIVPQIGTAIIGLGMISILMCIQTYLVDAFTIYAASAIAANAVLRSLLGALLPLCGLQVYDALGLGWGNTMLGLIALGLAPIPSLFGVYGERMRTSKRFQVTF